MGPMGPMGSMGPMGPMGMKAEPMGARELPSMKQGLSLGQRKSPLTKSSLDIAKQHQSKMNQAPTPMRQGLAVRPHVLS